MIKYTSSDIQNKIIDNRWNDTWKKCNDSEYFALIGDTTTDVSTHEQVSVCGRFVECTGGNTWRKIAMNYFCLRYVPNCNILTTAKNQYIDYLLLLVMIPLCWDDSWRFGLNIKTMSGCLLTSYMRTQYLVLFYIVMNVWPVVYLGRYTSLVSYSIKELLGVGIQ
jgi:hypothetical protein